MKSLKSFVFEKLIINKNIQPSKNPDDPECWEVGDVICAHGFRVEFYKIEKRTSKRFELLELGTKLVDGYYNSATYKAVPHGHPKDQKVVKGALTKNGMNIDGFSYNYIHLWDGNPVVGHGQ